MKTIFIQIGHPALLRHLACCLFALWINISILLCQNIAVSGPTIQQPDGTNAVGLYIDQTQNGTNPAHHTADRKLPARYAAQKFLPSGEYTVGSGGYFETIDDAFDYLSEKPVKGPITLLLIDELYLASEERGGTFTLAGPVIGANSTNTITIRPAENTAVTIKGNGLAVLLFTNVSYLTLDGISLTGKTRLTIHGTSTTANVRNPAIDFTGDCDDNSILRLTAKTDQTTSSAAIALRSDSIASPDYNLISGVHVPSASLGIFIDGYTNNTYKTTKPTGNIIRANTIGSVTENQIAWGIQVQHTEGSIIEFNDVENLRLEYQSIQIGINTYWGFNTVIRNNTVHNVIFPRKTGNVYGILASGDMREIGSNVWLYNNKVFDLHTKTITECGIRGITMWYQNMPKVDFNTVYLCQKELSAQYRGSTAAWFQSSVIDPTVRNNVFVNTRDDNPGYSYALVIATLKSYTDYNDLAVGSYPFSYIASTGVDYKTLADWQKIGKDTNSISVHPCFLCAHIHVDTLEPAMDILREKAIPIAGITTDYDGDLRSKDNPDIGADEFYIADPMLIIDNPLSVPERFTLLQNFPNPFNPSTTIRYALSPSFSPNGERDGVMVKLTIHDILGREVATLVNEEQSSGWKEAVWNAEQCSNGVYFYRLTAGDFILTKKMIVVK